MQREDSEISPKKQRVGPRPDRLIGRYIGANPGPTVIAVGGIHGNEPAGVLAAERVIQALEARQTEAHGTFIAFRGNTRALAQQVRYIEDDLNRMWSPERVLALQTARDPESGSPESQELLELLSSLNEAIGASGGPVYLLDLHTTSAGGAPFATIGDTLRNRKFARSFPLPVLLGLEEQIDGPLLEYMNDRGVITMGVEGGQHDSPKSIDTHEAVLWSALVRAGMIARKDIPNFPFHRDHLRSSSRGAPDLIAIRYRHDIKPKDKFVMDPGFENFQAVEKNQKLAQDRQGDVVAPEDGLILMPLYQGLGNDGFFLGRKISPRWLTFSTLLRKLRADRLMPLLPGVWRHPERPRTLIVNTRVARFYPLEIFHLFGYRKRRWVSPVLMVSRRRFDEELPKAPDWK